MKLLPCPICGNDKVRVGILNSSLFYVICQRGSCMTTGPGRDTQEEAMAAWNERRGRRGIPVTAEQIRSYTLRTNLGEVADIEVCAFLLREIAAQLADLNDALPRSNDGKIVLPIILHASSDDIPVRVKS